MYNPNLAYMINIICLSYMLNMVYTYAILLLLYTSKYLLNRDSQKVSSVSQDQECACVPDNSNSIQAFGKKRNLLFTGTKTIVLSNRVCG